MCGENPLHELLEECVVRIDAADGFRGSGFLVAPNEVVTCAHVVQDVEAVTVTAADWEVDGEVVERAPNLPADAPVEFQLPDLARITLPNAPSHPCVRLSCQRPRSGADRDAFRLQAYTKDEYAPDQVNPSPTEVVYVGAFGAERIFKFDKGQVIGGYSGCPALNLRTGCVVAVIDSSRNETIDLGGFGVPVAALDEAFDGVLERNREFHESDKRWEQAFEAEATLRSEREAASQPLSPPRLTLNWKPGEARSKLLRPRYGAVGMVGRDDLLDQLAKWRDAGEAVEVAVVTGGGGYGKTRLVLEECAAASRAGWTAGLLMVGENHSGTNVLRQIAAWQGRMVIAIDYAETRPGVVNDLLDLLLARQNGAPVRIVVACRRDLEREELERVFAKRGDRDRIEEVLQRHEPVRLGEQKIDRLELFQHGAREMAETMEVELNEVASPALVGDHFNRPLFVLAAALLWLEDQDLDVDQLDRDELMVEILERHESRYWESWKVERKLNLDPGMQRRLVAAAAALGANDEDEALALVGSVPGLKGFSAMEQREIAVWLSHLYGSGELGDCPAIAPLEPDSLAEILITDEYRSSPEMLAGSVGAASGAQRERFLTMVTRASETEGKKAPAEFAAEVFKRAAGKYRGDAGEDPDDRAALAEALRNFAKVLQNIGQPAEAVEAAQEAVDTYRVLAQESPERFRDTLIKELNNLAALLDEADENERAKAAIEEVVAYLQEDLDGN